MPVERLMPLFTPTEQLSNQNKWVMILVCAVLEDCTLSSGLKWEKKTYRGIMKLHTHRHSARTDTSPQVCLCPWSPWRQPMSKHWSFNYLTHFMPRHRFCSYGLTPLRLWCTWLCVGEDVDPCVWCQLWMSASIRLQVSTDPWSSVLDLPTDADRGFSLVLCCCCHDAMITSYITGAAERSVLTPCGLRTQSQSVLFLRLNLQFSLLLLLLNGKTLCSA